MKQNQSSPLTKWGFFEFSKCAEEAYQEGWNDALESAALLVEAQIRAHILSGLAERVRDMKEKKHS